MNNERPLTENIYTDRAPLNLKEYEQKGGYMAVRKALKENKRKIIVGSDFVNDLNAKAMSDFANRRLQYDNETMAGTVVEKHREWEKTIQDELAALKDYAIE